MWAKSKNHIDDLSYGLELSPHIRSRMIKSDICLMVASKVNDNLKDELVDSGFVVIMFNSTESFEVSVGWVDDCVVCGLLSK